MKAYKFIISLLFVSMAVVAQQPDIVWLGNNTSEQQHGYVSCSPQYTSQETSGFGGMTGRRALRWDENPWAVPYNGIYGGEFTVVVRVDPDRQNYVTFYTYGGDGVTEGERYRLQVDNYDLHDYSREAVSFSTEKAPGAFSLSTHAIPRRLTTGKNAVTLRVRSIGRYYGYATPGNFTGYQRVLKGDMPPIYAICSSTNPMPEINLPVEGSISSYKTVPAGSNTYTLEGLKTAISNKLSGTIKGQVEGDDFKPAYGNNNFNIVEAMGTAYQKGVYGTTAAQLAAKVRVAIDSMVLASNLIKQGVDITRSAIGNTATAQKADAGWGGLFGLQGYGMYQVWRAGQITNFYLDKEVDLGSGVKSRREQWIAAFRESFDVGSTTNRRSITNQVMEAAASFYGAALALYALDKETYYNAPRMGVEYLRQAVGLDYWTGKPKNAKFDGSITDDEGYPTYELGDPANLNSSENFWGKHFHVMTAKGNGREAGWTCPSCYGQMAPRITSLYLMTLHDPFIGTVAGGDGDKEILKMAVTNAKSQAHFAYPWVGADGNKKIISEGSICWRNRYEVGKTYYNNLIVAAISDDEELMGHVWQSYIDGNMPLEGSLSDRLFPYYSNSYWLPEAIDELIAFGKNHGSDYAKMPGTPGEPDYVFGDEQVGVVAIKHGDNHLFVNFYSENTLSAPGRAHLITPTMVRSIGFVPDVMRYTPSGKTTTIAEVYWNGNHKITYPDHLVMADAGSTYDEPAYDADGNYQHMRTLCNYYQQLLGNYLVAQNCSDSDTHTLDLTALPAGQKAIDIATGEEITLTDKATMQPRTTVAYYLTDYTPAGTDSDVVEAAPDTAVLVARVDELTTFAQETVEKLSYTKVNGCYDTEGYRPFMREIAMARYAAHSGMCTQQELDSIAVKLEEAYNTFVGTLYEYDACTVPGKLDYRKRIGQSGSVQVKSATSIGSAMTGASLFIPIKVTETGDYTIKVSARGYVYDSKEPSLNLTLFTDEQYQNGTKTPDAANTKLIAYNQFTNSTYRWYVHLEAGQTLLLKYTFGANVNDYTVNLAKTEIVLSTVYDALLKEIASAYATLEAHTDADSVAISTFSRAIAVAELTSESATETEINDARVALRQALNTFLSSITAHIYPSADIQFRVNNTGQSGTGAGLEVRNSSSGTQDFGFVGGIKFDISNLGATADEITSATLRLTTSENGGAVSIRPFGCGWGEVGGSTDSYASRKELIDKAIAAEEITTFNVALGGGRKMFEWIPSADYQYTAADWQVEVDMTDYLKSCITAGQTEMGLLLVPAGTSGTRSSVFCKDVCESTYGTSSTTDDYYYEGENIGEKTGASVSRWSRINQLLELNNDDVSVLYPRLSVKREVTTTGIDETEYAPMSPRVKVSGIYTITGIAVYVGDDVETALENLPAGFYIVNGEKYIKQ